MYDKIVEALAANGVTNFALTYTCPRGTPASLTITEHGHIREVLSDDLVYLYETFEEFETDWNTTIPEDTN